MGDIGLVSKIPKICLNEIVSLFGACLFENIKSVRNPEFWAMQQIFLKSDLGCFLYCLKYFCDT